ncbi:MAG: hypothetical protein GX173_10510 [Ruminococcaceae bacterium]|nr:hypothetical protein [Oscillospiraceae bacterium]
MKKDKDFIDDNRVIANMDVDGMPRSVLRKAPRPKNSDAFGQYVKKKEPIKLTRAERRSVIWGMVSSYLLFGGIVFGAFALILLFCIKVWFR